MKKFLPFRGLFIAFVCTLFAAKSWGQASIVYQSGDYRPVSAGVNFADDGLWQSYNGSAWTTVATSPQNLPVAAKPPRIIIDKASIDGAANSANTYNNIIVVSGGNLTLSDNSIPSADFVSSNNKLEVQSGGALTVTGQISINSNANFIVRSGGSATLNNSSIDNSHPIWAGIENFESGSVFNITNWNWSATAAKLNIINSSSSVSNNLTGFKFGILSLNVNPTISTWSLSAGTASFCDILNITNSSANAIVLTSDNSSPAITVRTINHNTGAFYLSGSLSGAATQTINILNNLNSTAGSLKLFYAGGGTASNVNVNLDGNLTVTGASSGFTNDGGQNANLNFTGTGIQTIDAAVTVTAVPMMVKNGAYVQLKNQDLTLNSVTNTNVAFTVATGGTLDFGFAANGTTALNIKKVATGGTNQFTSLSGSTLIITSPLGLQTSGTGNVQFSSASNITINQAATFWYMGRGDQVTGNALTSGGAARTVYVDLLDNTKILTLTNSVGISGGNKLEIQKGIVQGTSSSDFTGAGYLVMSDGDYQISTSGVTIPQLSGYSSYSLSGGTITLNGNNVNQTLSGVPPTYYNLTFSGTNTSGNSKGISSATNVTNNITISSSAIVDVQNKTLGGTGTASFTMTGTSRYITAGTLVKPDVGGTYSLSPGTTIEFSNTAATIQDIRLAPTYSNIEISGSGVGISTPTGSVAFSAGGTFTVKTGGTFKVPSTAGFSGSASTAINSSNNPTISLQTGSTIEYNGANQNISARTDYKNVTTSGSGVKTLAGDITVNGILKFSAGIITTNANKVVIPSTGSVTGGGTGWVNGNIQKNFSTGSNQSQVFEVGDLVYYSPVTITLPTVTTAGGLVVSATAAAYTPPAAILNSNRVVKRYWTIGSLTAQSPAVGYTGNYSAALNWNSNDNSGFSPALILSNLKSAIYNGTSWSYPTISSSPAATVTSATITGIAAKGNLILAEGCASSTNVKFTYTPAAWCISTPASAATTPVIFDSSGVSGTFNVPAGLAIDPTTGQITPNTSTANTYTVLYAIPATGGCSLLNASTIVKINSLPKLFTVTPAQSSYCTGGSGVKVGLSGSETGVSYQLSLNGTNSGSPVTGTNSAINFGNQTANGTYTVLATNATTGCTNLMTGSAIITTNTNNTAKVTVQPLPAVVCTGNATFTATATGTASPAYQWQVSLDTGKTYTNVVNGSLYSGTQTSALTITSPSTVSSPPLNGALYRVIAGTTFCYPDTSIGAILYTSSSNPWVGGVSSDGLLNANWCNGHSPNSDRDIIVPVVQLTSTPPHYYPVLTSKKTYRLIKNLYIAPTAIITIGLNRLTIRGSITGTGKIIGDTLASALQFDSASSGTLYFDQGKDSVSNSVQSLVMNTTGTINVATKLYIIDSLTSILGTLNTNDSLTLRSTTIDSTAQVTAVTGTINGKVTVERFITAKRAFRFLSPSVTTTGSIKANWMEGASNTNPNNPVNPHPGYGTEITGNKGAVNGFDQTPTNNPSLYTYNKTLNIWDSLLTTSGTLTAGVPLRLLIRGDRSLRLTTNTPTPTKTILREFGTLFIGTKTLNASNTPTLNGAANGFSFIGNPYASPVRWDSIYNSSSNITPSYYAYDPNINQKGAYVSYNSILGYNSTFGVSAVDNNIQSGQGFLIQNTAGTIPSLKFKETYKSSKNTKVFKTMSIIPTLGIQLLRFNSTDSSFQFADGSIAAYDNQFSDSISDEDSYKFNNQDENISIFRNGKYLSIEGRPTITANDTISLQMWQFRQSSYYLKLNPVNFATGVTAVLKDAYLNTTTPVSLSAITMVPFSITTDSASYAIGRFAIIFNNNSTLPVTITNVKAYRKGEGIQVDWVAQTETNIDRYEVEASSDGRTFEKTATIKAKGNNTVTQNYGWYDENSSAGNHFYRIKVTEKSGAVKYTEIVKVNIAGGNSSISVYPNPVKGKTLAVHLVNIEKGKYNVTLYNDLGQQVYAGAIDHAGGSVTYNIVTGNKLSQESYKLIISDGDTVMTETIVFE